jgi:hypothetical protein
VGSSIAECHTLLMPGVWRSECGWTLAWGGSVTATPGGGGSFFGKYFRFPALKEVVSWLLQESVSCCLRPREC